ncbi:MAG: hypothetical protein JXA69_16325 [Phycisphaerae bacterium]|nr:hypothetical protein [Phycisphaerae bacterium]
MNRTPSTAYERIQSIIEGRWAAARRAKQTPEYQQLVHLIESDRYLVLGAKAMAAYVRQRFVESTEYLVGHRAFGRIRKWLADAGVPFDDEGEAIRVEQLGIDVIDAANNPVLKEMLNRETGVPSVEALAASKYVAIVSGTRGAQRVHFDIGDFIGLVCLDSFDVGKFLGCLVDRYAEQRSHASEIIARIRRGDAPITF